MPNRYSKDRKHSQNKKCECFTLVELLVTISVIVMLISILMPALRKARESAKSINCMNNLKQCVIGTTSYGSDYNETLLMKYGDGANQSLLYSIATGIYGTVSDARPKYLGSLSPTLCPAAPPYAPPRVLDNNMGGTYAVPYSITVHPSYAAAPVNEYNGGGLRADTGKPSNSVVIYLPRLKSPSTMLCFAESYNEANQIQRFFYSLSNSNIDFRHNNRTNIAWFDGHVNSNSLPTLRDSWPLWHGASGVYVWLNGHSLAPF